MDAPWHLLCFHRRSMQEFAQERYPLRSTLKNDAPCSIRPMETGDESAFRDFHLVIPEEEQLFIRSEIKDGTLFRHWMADPEQFLPLLAFVDGKLLALGVLEQHLGGWKRHIGNVTFLTHPDFHGVGLINLLVDEIVEASRASGLTKLETELNGERKSAIDTLAKAGFTELVRLPHYIQDMRGISHDYVLLGMNLVADFENLGAGD